jgi:hypothetical protein
MKTTVLMVLLSLVISLPGCGPTSGVQLPENPTPPPAHGPQSATVPNAAGERRLD